jgi:hypothetical protein
MTETNEHIVHCTFISVVVQFIEQISDISVMFVFVMIQTCYPALCWPREIFK